MFTTLRAYSKYHNFSGFGMLGMCSFIVFSYNYSNFMSDILYVLSKIIKHINCQLFFKPSHFNLPVSQFVSSVCYTGTVKTEEELPIIYLNLLSLCHGPQLITLSPDSLGSLLTYKRRQDMFIFFNFPVQDHV
jgi:hypothetical protein